MQILTSTANVYKHGVEMAVRSVSGSSAPGPNTVVHNLEQGDFSRNMEKTPLMSASSRADSRIDQDRSDETPNVGKSEYGDFTVLRPNCDRHLHPHHRTV